MKLILYVFYDIVEARVQKPYIKVYKEPKSNNIEW